MQAGQGNIVFDISLQLVGVPPSPGLVGFASSRTRLTAWLHASHDQQGKGDGQRHRDSRRAAQGTCPLAGAERRKLPGAVSRAVSDPGSSPAGRTNTLRQEGIEVRRSLTLRRGSNLAYKAPGPTRAGLPGLALG